MAMEDALKIILSAELENSSWENLVEKINKLKGSLNNIKIKIVEEGNFSQNIQKLTENLEALNRTLKELSDRQSDVFKNIRDESQKSSQQVREDLKNEEKQTKELTEATEQLLKTRQKMGKNPTNEVTTGNKIRQTTTRRDAEGNVESQTVTTNYEKATQNLERMADLFKSLKNQQGDLTSKQREFLELYDKLDVKSKDFVANSRQANTLHDDLVARERALLDVTERRANAEKEMNRMKEAGATARTTRPINEALTAHTPESIFGGRDDPREDWQKQYNRFLEQTNQALQESLELEKRLNLVREHRPKLQQQRDELRDRGFNVEGINALLGGNRLNTANNDSEQLAQHIREVQEAIQNLSRSDRTLESLENKLRRLGITLSSTFKGATAGDNREAIDSEMQSIYTQINALRQRGVTITDEEIRGLQREHEQLQQNLRTRQEEQRVAIAQAREQNRIRGDVRRELTPEENQRAFGGDSHLANNQAMRDIGRAFAQAEHPAENFNEAVERIRVSQDSLGNSTAHLTYDIRDSNGEVRRYTVALDQATGNLYNLGASMQHAGSQGNLLTNTIGSIGQSFARVPAYLASFGLVYEVWNQVTESLRTVYEIDEAMTDLAKVTDATTSEFESFRNEASLIGENLGATTVEVTKAVTEFQKLGYSFAESKNLGETALVYSNVGDMDIDEASQSLVSALKGFGVSEEDVVKESQKYVDIFNEVGNQYAVSSAGLGEALQRSSAQLHEAGNSVEQSVAMITSANAVIQDENKVGTAMKTISMRLRGVQDEGDMVTNLMPKLGDAFGQVGVKLTDANGEFKGTYDILGELAGRWDTLSSMQKANLTELIAGKHHATVMTAMMGNWKDATNSYATATESAGSATAEFAKYQESLGYRVDRLKATYEEFWMSFWDDNAIKNAVSGLTAIIKVMATVVQTFGSLPTVMLALTPPLLLFQKTLRSVFVTRFIDVTNFRNALYGTGTAMTGMARATTVATTALKAFSMATLWGLAFAVAMWGLVKAYDAVTGAHKKYVEQLTNDYEATKNEVDAMGKFDFTRYNELEIKKGQGQLDNSQEQEYVALQDELLSTGQDVIAYYDAEGKAHLKTAEQLRKLNEEKREELHLIRERKVEEDKKELTGKTFKAPGDKKETSFFNQDFLAKFDADAPVHAYEDDIANLKKLQDQADSLRKDTKGMKLVQNIVSDSDLGDLKVRTTAFNSEIDKIKAKVKDLHDNGQISDDAFRNSMNVLNDFNPTAGNVQDGLNEVIRGIKGSSRDLDAELRQAGYDISDSAGEFKEVIDEEFSNMMDTKDIDPDSNAEELAKGIKDAYLDALDKGNFKDVESAVNDASKNMGDLFSAIQSQDIDMAELVKGTPEAVKQLENLGNQMGLTAQQSELLRTYIASLHAEQITGGGAVANTEAYINAVQSERNGILAEYQSRSESLATAIQTVANGENLTLQQITELTDMYPQLTEAVTVQNGVQNISVDALQNVADAEENSAKTKINAMKVKIQADIDELNAFLNNASAQVKGLMFLDEAYKQSATTTAHTVAWQMAQADAAAYQADLIAQGLTKTAKDTDWNAYARRMQSGYELIARGQAKSAIGALQTQLKNLNNLSMTDLSKQVQKSTAPIKTDKPKAGAKTAEAKAVEKLTWVTDEYKDTMLALNKQLLAQKNIMEQFPNYSKPYQNALKKSLELNRKMITASEKEEKNLNDQIKTQTLRYTGLVKADEAIRRNPAGTGGATRTTSTLRIGSRGNAVKELQKKLGIKADGIFGNQTANAVRNYQRSHKLGVDGIVGRQTLTSLGMYGATTTTKGAVAGATTRTLRVGTRGEDVKALQRKLGITADGIFGNQTAKAVRSYQSKHGLSADSIAGKNTLTALGLYGKGTTETQNDIAKFKEELSKRKDDALRQAEVTSKQKAEYNASVNEYFDSIIAGVDHDRKRREDDVAKLDFQAIHYSEESLQGRKIQQDKINLLLADQTGYEKSISEMQSEISKGELSLNEKLEEGVYDRIEAQRKSLIETQKALFEAQQNLESSVINEIMNNYEDDIGKYDDTIARLQNKMEALPESDLDRYADFNNQVEQALQSQIETNRVRLAQLKAEESRVKNFPELYKDWKNNVRELTNAQEDLNVTLQDTRKEMLERQEGTIDNLVDAYKEYYEKLQDMETDSLDKQRDAEDKLHDDREERWDEELQKYQDNVQKQLDALDKAEEDRTYQRDLTDKQKARQDILSRIGLVSLDSSAEGRQRLRQLQDELETATTDINEMIHQRQLEDRRKALEEQLNAREKENDKLTEAEDNRYDLAEKAFDDHEKEIEKKWENLIENERNWAKLREDLLAGNMNEMTSQVDSFVATITSSSKDMGEAISTNLIDNFMNARKELVELDAVLSDSQITFNKQFGSSANNWYNSDDPTGLVTQDMIDKTTIPTPNVYYVLPNPSTLKNEDTPQSNITINMNVGTVTGGQEGADQLVQAVADGLASRGVTLG